MSVRDDAARARDAAATARDAAADARDATMRWLDLENGQGGFPRSAVNALLRAAAQRKRAAEQRDLAALVREVVLAATDPLTGARMRGSGLTNLANEIDRCRRTGQRLVVIYIDTVGLKACNDTYGHTAGNALLQRVVAALREHLRSYDLVIRLGGDEPTEITSGFAELEPQETVDELIARADQNLFARRQAAGPRGDGSARAERRPGPRPLRRGRRAARHGVAASRLRCVERGIGPAHEGVGMLAGEVGYADADGRRQQRSADDDGHLRDRSAHALGHDDGSARPGGGENHQELLAAPAPDEVPLAQRLA